MRKDLGMDKKILKVAGSLFSKRGYFGTSMSDIAHEVGVGKSALYYYFESKEVLCRKLMQSSCNELKMKLKSSAKNSVAPFDVLFNVVKTLLDFRIEHPEISLLTSITLSSGEKDPIVQFIVELRVSILKLTRKLIGDLDLVRRKGRKFLFVFSASILGFVFGPLVPKNMNSEELSKQLTKTLLNNKNQKVYA